MPDTALVDKFAALETAVNAEVVERPTIIHGICVALVAAHHLFLLGTPGVAKSYALNRLLARIEGVHLFHTLMMPFTTPDEVLGPKDIPAMKEGRERRNTELYLPWADVVNLEEIWKANSAILNALLSATQERKFRNDGAWVTIPLSTLVCSSNELPGNETLAALRDRILLTYQPLPIQDTGNRVHMLELDPPEDPEPMLTWGDVEKAKAEVKAMPISRQVIETLASEMHDEMAAAGIVFTDRRLKQVLELVKAEAWLDGADQAELDHLSIVQHCWERPEQADDLRKIVLARANPLEKESMDLMTAADGISKEIDNATKGANANDKFKLGYEIQESLDRAHEDLMALYEQAGTSKRQLGLLDQVKHRLHGLTVRMIEDVFNLSVESVGDIDKLFKPKAS